MLTRIPVLLPFLLLFAAPASAQEQWVVEAGNASLRLHSSRLEALGLEVGEVWETAGSADATGPAGPTGEPGWNFALDPSAGLSFRAVRGVFAGWMGGSLRMEGGFSLLTGAGKRVFFQAALGPAPGGPATSLVLHGGGPDSPVVFDLTNAKIHFFPKAHVLKVIGMDVRVRPRWAQTQGRPDLGGQLVGGAGLVLQARWTGGARPFIPPPSPPSAAGAGIIDAQLFRLMSLSDLGHTGTFPNGDNGLSMATTICNVGDTEIPWFAPMNEKHPMIVMNLYRIDGGRLEQIGMAWIKHTFFSTNLDQCATCQNPFTGTKLGVNCSDTYGTDNNGDRRWLGPRGEVDPFQGTWNCTGSYFSDFQPDCVRRNNGSGLGPIAHRLEVLDSDLDRPGARFFYEAWYVVESDVDVFNSSGYREVAANWNGSIWNFPNIGGKQPGPAIMEWGDMQSFAQPGTDGNVIVASQATDLGNGSWHYEYAVYIFNFNREIRFFGVPAGPGVKITNIGFRDVDQDPLDDWAAVRKHSGVLWKTSTFQDDPAANSIKYGTLYNFWFDADSAPRDTKAPLKPFRAGGAGSPAEYDAGIRGPEGDPSSLGRKI